MQVAQHPVHGAFKMPGWPVRIDGAPPRVAASPTLGQHTGEVLGSWLDMTDAQVAALQRDGAIK